MIMPVNDAEVSEETVVLLQALNLYTIQAVYALISPKIQPFAEEPNTYGVPCSELSSLAAAITLHFTSEDGQPLNLTIPSSELSVGPFKSNTDICQTLINTMDDTWIVGASLFKHYYSVWDLGQKRLGFAPTIRYVI